jgi:hypothetical protein
VYGSLPKIQREAVHHPSLCLARELFPLPKSGKKFADEFST